jgi:hypothetical protein
MTSAPDPPVPRQALPQRISAAKVWALLYPYWFSDERWGGRGLRALVVGLNLAGVFLAAISPWRMASS